MAAKGGINFLSQHRKKLTKQQKLDRQFFRIASIISSIILALSLISVAASVSLQLAFNQLKSQESELERAILFQEELEESAVIISSKLNLLSQLIEKRHNKQEAIQYFGEVFGTQVLVKDVNYEASASILSMKLEAPSVFVFERVFELLESDQTKRDYAGLNKSEVRRGSDGSYQVTLTVVLNSPTAAPTPR